MATERTGSAPSPAGTPAGTTASGPRRSLWERLEDQLALRQLIDEYLIPVEENTIWYTLGGVLAIALVLEMLTGGLLSLRYVPDAGRAYGITVALMHERLWSVVINFHYFNAFLIFILIMVHMMRVFISGGYRRGKESLWLIGVALAGVTFILALTGESLHWDEVGFAVPWHISELLQAIHLDATFQYGFADLRSIASATPKLGQLYAAHISITPILLLLLLAMHYYLIREKKVSLPFWVRPSGRTAPFSRHMREWILYGGLLLGAVLILAVFVDRGTGIAPQLLPSSPFYGAKKGPGALGAKPSYPISWTHGMNLFVNDHLGINPDIWGTVIGMALMLGALVAIPFLDRGNQEPATGREAFDWRRRGWAFVAIAIFWITMITGMIQNAVGGPG
jgi:quinol-cytochrome oxidoreductase complex cytochrome b subunit